MNVQGRTIRSQQMNSNYANGYFGQSSGAVRDAPLQTLSSQSASVGKKKTYIVVQAGRGQKRQSGMWLEAVDYSAFVARKKLDYLLRLFFPDVDVAAVASTHHVLGIRSVEIDALRVIAIMQYF